MELQGDRARARAGRAARARRARRRGGRRPRRPRRGAAAGASGSSGSASSAAVRLRRRSSSSAALRAMPNSHARCVPRSASNVDWRAVGALERRRGDVLGGRAVAQQRQRRRRRRPTPSRGTAHRTGRVVGSEVESSMTDPTPTLRPAGRSITRRYIARVRPRAVPIAAPPSAAARARRRPPRAADDAPSRRRSRQLLWATINVCDTAKHPDTIGIRASMPGSGTKGERMYMRFQVQYFQRVGQQWAPTRRDRRLGLPVGRRGEVPAPRVRLELLDHPAARGPDLPPARHRHLRVAQRQEGRPQAPPSARTPATSHLGRRPEGRSAPPSARSIAERPPWFCTIRAPFATRECDTHRR